MKKSLITICIVLCTIFIIVCIWSTSKTLLSIGIETDFNVESPRWSITGTVGGWGGFIFRAIAFIVLVIALWHLQRIKIKVSISGGIMLSQMPGVDTIDAYKITVKNIGMKSVTIQNLYLHFGGEKQGDIFIGMLNHNS